MPVFIEEELIPDAILINAKQMIAAAKTAPKARGIDNLTYTIITGKEITLLAEKMIEIGTKQNIAFFVRDGENIKTCTCIVLIGTKIQSIGLQDICGLCGYKNCIEKDKHPNHPCIYNTNDMGIAIGSAVSVAMNNKIDNRVMFSIGKAAQALQLVDSETKIALGIPLSATSKNTFFDRK